MKSKAYRAVDVKHVQWERLVEGKESLEATVGLDIGKERIYGVLRWGALDFERPWRIDNPAQIGVLTKALAWLAQGRRLIVAMEPTGTYGDVLRQALSVCQVEVRRVSPKAASDFAEIFDGVPSQHDGKDAAVVAELAAGGRSWAWPWREASAQQQELAYWVHDLEGQRRQMMTWFGRLEALVSRHWPEATRIVRLRSAVLLKCLAHYGSAANLAADATALSRVQKWGRHLLSSAKAQALVASASTTVGVHQGEWDQARVQDCVGEILRCRQRLRQARQRLQVLGQDNEAIVAMAGVVGMATACVLWEYLGDPRDYHCAQVYRKAMGLNLAERSSGKYKGELKISKRGSSVVRRWLYLAALRHIRREPTKTWYQQQKKDRRGEGKPAVIAVMRKLALALYHVAHGKKFSQHQLQGTSAEA